MNKTVEQLAMEAFGKIENIEKLNTFHAFHIDGFLKGHAAASAEIERLKKQLLIAREGLEAIKTPTLHLHLVGVVLGKIAVAKITLEQMDAIEAGK